MSGNAKKIGILVALVILVPVAIMYANRQTPEQKARSEHYAQVRAARNNPAAAAPKKGAKPGAAKEAAEDGVESQFDLTKVDIQSLLQNIQDVEFEYSLERANRDPMSPLIGIQAEGTTTDQSQPQLGADQRLIQTARLKAVSGIVWDDQTPYAVIDNEVVSEGYSYPEGIVLDEIHLDHVVFRVNDARVEVELKEQ